MKKRMFVILAAIAALVLAMLACNDANVTTNTAASGKPFKSVTVVAKTAADEKVQWVETSEFKIDGFMIQQDPIWFGGAKYSVQDAPYETLDGSHVLILEMQDGSKRSFEWNDGKLMMNE